MIRIKGKKLSLSALLMSGALLTQGTYAETPATPQSSLMPQFYAGASIGIQHLKGKRTEYVNSTSNGTLDPFIGTQAIPFSDSTAISNRNGYYSAHAGLTWNIPETIFFVGSEVHLGRGSATHDLKVSVADNHTFTSRDINVSIRQSTFWGGTLHLGVNCKWDSRVYLLLGLETSQFEYTGTYKPREQSTLHGLVFGGYGPPNSYPVTLLKKRSWSRGSIWGFGVEKRFGSFRLGADLRIVQYRELKNSQKANTFEPETVFSSFKPKNVRFGLKLSYLF